MGLPHPLFCAVGTETAVPISLGSDGGVVTSAVQSYIQYINIKGENEENGENMGKRGKYGNIWGKYGENHQEIDTKNIHSPDVWKGWIHVAAKLAVHPRTDLLGWFLEVIGGILQITKKSWS